MRASPSGLLLYVLQMRWLVTGTDTGIGKTFVTACLAAGARQLGWSVCAAKPVASGIGPESSDAQRLAHAAGHEPRNFASFVAAISPHRAAQLEGSQLDVDGLRFWLRELDADVVFVEGIGGWRVTLAPDYELCDLARDFAGPVLIVAADRIGVINHVRLTVEAIRRDGLPIAGVILNRGLGDTSPPGAANLADLAALLAQPVVPLGATSPSGMAAAGAQLWKNLGLSPNMR